MGSGGGAVGQGAGVAGLLESFDAVGTEHERMAPDTFNNDTTYKNGINEARGLLDAAPL